MSLIRPRRKPDADSVAQGVSRDVSLGQPVWLPGTIEVQVAGESFHEDAIRTAEKRRAPGSPFLAVLKPDPGNVYDSNAVAVYVNGEHVGFLPREVARRVQVAIATFSNAHDGRLVSCPAEIRWHDVGPQVVLLLDPRPLGLQPEAFEAIPDMAVTIMRLLARLDEPSPPLTGEDAQARWALEIAQGEWEETEANHDRRPRQLRQVELALRGVADRLAATGDPAASDAWLSVARATRYQRGRRDETLTAWIEALYWDRSNGPAWCELLDYASAAPSVPMLLALFKRIPVENRKEVLSQLLSMSEGHDRFGRLHVLAGERLREGLLDIAEFEGDRATIGALVGYAGLAAEKAGDLDAAARYWQQAIVAGSADASVADRFSVWLVKRHEYQEAAAVLRQALSVDPGSAEGGQRMLRRLARCERMMTPGLRMASVANQPESETLICHECGQAFQRSRARGRKPLCCPDCASKH